MKKTLILLAVLAAMIFTIAPTTTVHAQSTTARALVVLHPECSQFLDTGDFNFCWEVWVYPVGGSGRTQVFTNSSAAAGDNASQIYTKITDAVIAAAAAQGYTVSRTQMLIPSYQRGQ